jgi:hypothetical protein
MSLFATLSMTLRMNDIEQLTLILAVSSVYMLSTTCFIVVLNVIMLSVMAQENGITHRRKTVRWLSVDGHSVDCHLRRPLLSCHNVAMV